MLVEDCIFWQDGDFVTMEFNTTTSSKLRKIQLPKKTLPEIVDRLAATMEESTAKHYRTQGLFVCKVPVALMIICAVGVICLLIGGFLV